MMKVGGLTSREQKMLVAGGLLAALVLWLYIAYVVQPLLQENVGVGQDVSQARQDLKTLEAATAHETAMREQHQQLNETVTSLQRLLPAERELPAVIELLSDLASQSDVKIQSIFPQRSTPGEEKKPVEPNAAGPLTYKDVVIQIDAMTGFHQLGTFLSLVEAQENPMQIAALKITSDPKVPKRQKVKLLIRSYFLVGEPNAPRSTPADAPSPAG